MLHHQLRRFVFERLRFAPGEAEAAVRAHWYALGLKANDELHARWKEYLDDAEEAVASVGINTDDKGSVKGFLNRLLGMCVKMQNKVFDHFMAILEEKVRVAKQNGEFDDGVVDIRGESVKVGPPRRGAAPGDASRTLLGTVP